MSLNIQQHTADCPICKGKANFVTSIKFKFLVGMIDSYTQNIYVCDNCNFIFTNNYIDNEIINNYYKNLSKYEGNNSGEVDLSKKLMSQRQFDFVNSTNIKYKSVLEIGASIGFNLFIFKNNQKEVYGVEPSANNKITAKNLYNIDLFDGMYEEFYELNKAKQYDLIIMSHVLEHMHNPYKIIQQVSEQNTKYIYIEVPSFEIQIETEPYGSFFYEDVNHFTTNSLSYLMQKNGYSAIKLSIDYNMNGESPNYPVICSLWKKTVNSKLIKTVLNSSLLMNNYLEKSEFKFKNIKIKILNIPSDSKIAIWGTGSHTSRLFGMTNLSDKNIVKFYDSDIKRHQFKILDKEITAFNIEDIENGLVDTILISTYSGEKSILNYLKSLNLNIDIIALYNDE